MRWSLKISMVALVAGAWVIAATLCPAQDEGQHRSETKEAGEQTVLGKLLARDEGTPRPQVQPSDLEDVVCVYDQAGDALCRSLQPNVYGALPAGVDSVLHADKHGVLFSPTDRRDHLASPFADLIPCRPGRVRCLILTLSPPAETDRRPLSLSLQRDGCADLISIPTVNAKGKPVEQAGPIMVPEDARQFRVVIQSPAQVPLLLPAAIRVEAGYFSRTAAVHKVGGQAELAVAVMLSLGLLALGVVGFVQSKREGRLTGRATLPWAGRGLLDLLRDLAFTRWGSRTSRSLLSAAALWCIVMGAGLALNRECFRPFNKSIPDDQHAMFSLETAINHMRFGAISHLYVGNQFVERDKHIFTLIPDNPTLLSERLRDLPEQCTDSTDYYVHNLTPFLNNENSLMLINKAVLWLVPDITLSGLIQVLLLLKVACLAVFVFFLLRVGCSLLLSLSVLHVSLVLVLDVNQYRPLSLYPFLLPLTLLLVAMLGLTLSFGLNRRLWQHGLALLVVGFVGAFLTNLRTSYFPLVASLPLLYVAIACLDWRRALHFSWVKTGLLAAVALGCFFAGSKTFTATFIAPLEKACKDNYSGIHYSYHVIAHPLVLFLAVPPNELAHREGIEYHDSYGLKLARRIDPSVEYLGKHYDEALLVYYFKLWLYNPSEMLHLYRTKFQLAATTASQAATVSDTKWLKWFDELAVPLRKCANWLIYMALFTALAVVPMFVNRLLAPARAFAVSALAAAGLLLFIELGWLSSAFCMTYNSYLYFWFLFIGMLCYQAIADGVFHAVRYGIQTATKRLGSDRKTTENEELVSAGLTARQLGREVA
jgi:hypothetical protein